MPTIAQIVDLYPIAQYLAANDLPRKGLYSGGVNLLLPQKIRNIGDSVKRIFDYDPNDDTLPLTANFLWTLCGKYGLQAQAVTQSGGSVSPITPINPVGFPIYLTQASFTTATFYPNTTLYGNDIAVFWNEINRYLDPATEFSFSPAGLTILIPGFDATLNPCTFVIEKVYPA